MWYAFCCVSAFETALSFPMLVSVFKVYISAFSSRNRLKEKQCQCYTTLHVADMCVRYEGMCVRYLHVHVGGNEEQNGGLVDDILTFEISLVAGKQTFSYSCSTTKKSSKRHHYLWSMYTAQIADIQCCSYQHTVIIIARNSIFYLFSANLTLHDISS